eukprot:CAMPEP_0183390416 /NCGR_PEP_ID=MMETSP0370-20130417/5685_1 /TAXON_ID=268820 /ORGANISM="Peridinium aciculiferum, Strain PAER-2" /LENGTH=86 /DNA_ID=CAMNT_0025569913 /DNA_START=257 /DNA_END=517 /DNA_ORIENTATION=-
MAPTTAPRATGSSKGKAMARGFRIVMANFLRNNCMNCLWNGTAKRPNLAPGLARSISSTVAPCWYKALFTRSQSCGCNFSLKHATK